MSSSQALAVGTKASAVRDTTITRAYRRNVPSGRVLHPLADHGCVTAFYMQRDRILNRRSFQIAFGSADE
jgi:hypothetical protein